MSKKKAKVRTFATGATCDIEFHKPDIEAFESPIVDQRKARYMHEHRFQKDGTVRDGDNWQNGMSRNRYIKSLDRHVLDVRLLHRGYPAVDYETGKPVDLEDALCAIIFNSQAYLHEVLLRREIPDPE